jgi:hypothetical protein
MPPSFTLRDHRLILAHDTPTLRATSAIPAPLWSIATAAILRSELEAVPVLV